MPSLLLAAVLIIGRCLVEVGQHGLEVPFPAAVGGKLADCLVALALHEQFVAVRFREVNAARILGILHVKEDTWHVGLEHLRDGIEG